MRILDFWLDRNKGIVAQSLTSAAPNTGVTIIRNDVLQINLHSVVQNPAVPALTPYVESPCACNSARVSIGLIDTPPTTGTFCLQVGGQTTAPLAWPTAAALAAEGGVAAWKTAMLDALIALSTVGDYNGGNGGTAGPAVFLNDPPSAPAHFNYFAWADPTRQDLITVVQNRLLPLTLPKAIPYQLPDGFCQLLIFRQAPVAMCTDFANPYPPVCTISQTVLGAVGTNEEQTLAVPAGAGGSVQLGWNGATTETMDVATITAPAIANALNAIVADGATNPSFAATQVTTTDGSESYAIDFVGPLAGAPQAMLTVIMVGQIALPYVTGIFDLSASQLPIDEDLDGQPDADLTLEIVLDTPNDETYLIPVEIDADMTDPTTAGDVGGAGGVIVRDQIVYVFNDDPTNPQPVIEAAPGCVYVPTAPGQNFQLPHNLNTWQPFVRISRQISTDPEVWEQVADTEFTADATDANDVKVSFATWTLNNTPGDPFYYQNFKIFVTSPNAQMLVYQFNLTWDQVLDYLPGGQSVRQKFAAIDAALGITSGKLTISAANITGTLSASQIDLDSLSAALATNATFLQTYQNLANNATFLTNLFNAATSNAAFITALTNIAGNSSFLSALVTGLLSNADFSTAIATLVSEALQDGMSLPTGITTLYNIPDLVDLFPSPRSAPPSSASSQTTSASASSSSGITASIITPTPAIPPMYQPLPAAVIAPVDKGVINGELPLAGGGNAGWKYIVQGSATARTLSQRRGAVFPDGSIVVSDGRQWYQARLDSGSYYPVAMERSLFVLPVRAEQIWAGTRFSVNFPFQIALLGNVTGEYLLRIRTGTAQQTPGGGANLSSIAWDNPVIEERIVLSAVPTVHAFGYAVLNTAGVLSATKTLYQQSGAANGPQGPNFVVSGRLECFSITSEPGEAFGAVSLAMKNARGSVAEVTS